MRAKRQTRLIVVGAGASIEEARRSGAAEEFWPPTMMNFAEKMWDSPHNQFFNYWLPDFLVASGVNLTSDPTSTFIRLARDPTSSINVERLFEFCWMNKGTKFKDDWENLIYHGVLSPLQFLLLSAFYCDGKIRQLEAAKLVAGKLCEGDVVMNLNYDTLFEIALGQAGCRIAFSPSPVCEDYITIAKPHGSLNLLANETSFHFAQPDCVGALPSSGDNLRNWVAIVPPRFNKAYAQHPIAKRILGGIADFEPSTITFWGVGLTDSDTDLLALYKQWAVSAATIEVINPTSSVCAKAEGILKRRVRHFPSLETWCA